MNNASTSGITAAAGTTLASTFQYSLLLLPALSCTIYLLSTKYINIYSVERALQSHIIFFTLKSFSDQALCPLSRIPHCSLEKPKCVPFSFTPWLCGVHYQLEIITKMQLNAPW